MLSIFWGKSKPAKDMNTLKFQYYLGKILYSPVLKNYDPWSPCSELSYDPIGHSQMDMRWVSDLKTSWDKNLYPKETPVQDGHLSYLSDQYSGGGIKY